MQILTQWFTLYLHNRSDILKNTKCLCWNKKSPLILLADKLDIKVLVISTQAISMPELFTLTSSYFNKGLSNVIMFKLFLIVQIFVWKKENGIWRSLTFVKFLTVWSGLFLYFVLLKQNSIGKLVWRSLSKITCMFVITK